jgi:ribonuclease P/MRP protein subunit POP7
MSAVKRVRKQLDKSQRAGSAGAAHKNASLHARIEALKRDVGSDGQGAVVTLMGTGKAVAKTVSLASWFTQQADCAVEVRTRTVATVDDVVGGGGGEEEESRVRKLSCLEVAISLK